jgi:hypothetical protein
MTDHQHRPTPAPSRPVQRRSVSSAVAALPTLGNSALACPTDAFAGLRHDLPSVLSPAGSPPSPRPASARTRNMHS